MGTTTFLQNAACASASATLILLAPTPARAGIQYDSTSQTWKLASGPVEYRLHQEGESVYLEYFGPSGGKSWKPLSGGSPEKPSRDYYDLSGLAEGQTLLPENLVLISHEIVPVGPGREGLRLVFKHRTLPLRIEVHNGTCGETGVLTRQVSLVNQGNGSVRIDSLPSLAWRLPSGRYELSYLWSGWGQECSRSRIEVWTLG